MKHRVIAALSCALLATGANAQTQPVATTTSPTPVAVTPAPMPQQVVPMIAPAETPSVLRAGTKVPLKMAEALTTKGKNLRVGQRFQLEVAEDIRLGEHVVIPAGTPAIGEITEVRNKGMWGKSGRIGAQLVSLRVNGRQIRLTGSFDDKGVTGTAGVVAAVAFVPIAGFFTTGTSANLPLGGAVTGFLDEDVPVVFAAAPAPAPVVVAVPAAPAQPVPAAPAKAQ